MTGYVLIVSIITSYGAVSTQRETGFSSYDSCAAHAVASVESLPLQPGEQVRWHCEHGDE
jgi:hypothetical protein